MEINILNLAVDAYNLLIGCGWVPEAFSLPTIYHLLFEALSGFSRVMEGRGVGTIKEGGQIHDTIP